MFNWLCIIVLIRKLLFLEEMLKLPSLRRLNVIRRKVVDKILNMIPIVMEQRVPLGD